jgi:FixJ family two-component response regulator
MATIATEREHPHILIVDDDEEVRTALRELLSSVGLDATCFASTREFLDADLPRRPGCPIRFQGWLTRSSARRTV